MKYYIKALAKCGGANIEILKKCPVEITKYVSIGITILFTGIFAGLSGGYAFYRIFNKEILNETGQEVDSFVFGSIILGILWGIMILNLDRFIVMSIRKRNNKWMELLTATPRIILAIVISFVVAKPLEIRLFRDRIEGQLSDNEIGKRETNKKKIYNITGKEIIDSLSTKASRDITNINLELQNDCPSIECKDAFKAQQSSYENYLTIRKDVQTKIAEANANILFINNGDKYKNTLIENGKVSKTLSEEGERLKKYYNDKISDYILERVNAFGLYDQKRNVYNNLNKNYKNELKEKLLAANKESDQLGRQKREADSLTSILTTKAGQASSIAFTNNFISQIDAFGDLTKWKYDIKDTNDNVVEKANNTMWYINFAIILLIFIVESAPIFVKLISDRGQYDIALEAEDMKKEAEFIQDANTNISYSDQNNQLKLQSLMENQVAQLNVLQLVIKAWQNKKKNELKNGQINDFEYKSMIKDILEFTIIERKSDTNNESNKGNIFTRIFKKLRKTAFINFF